MSRARSAADRAAAVAPQVDPHSVRYRDLMLADAVSPAGQEQRPTSKP